MALGLSFNEVLGLVGDLVGVRFMLEPAFKLVKLRERLLVVFDVLGGL